MNRKISIIIALIVALAMGGCNNSQQRASQKSSENKKEVIEIGADFTLSGNISAWSIQLKNGLDIAINDFNKKSKKYKISVIYEDNKGKTSEAVLIFKKFSDMSKVATVISCFTPISQAIRDLADQSKLPLIATVTSATNFSINNKWVVRDFVTQEQQVPPLAKYAFTKLGLKNATSLVVNDDYGLDAAKIFKKEFENLGGTFYHGDVFEQNTISVRNQITKVLKNHPDVILVVGREIGRAHV